jgi:CRP-like cAMP-binding protein
MPRRGVDLSHVEALSDLPDDARDAFADAATVQDLTRDEEVSGFALAIVVEGTVDLAATMVDASALTLEAGAVLRSRGTIDQAAPLRLVALSEKATVATWDERAVDAAFRTCPWVEDELRSAGDRLQALVGATMGALGDRLDPTLRADVTSKLAVHALAEHEVFAHRGQPIPGLLVVGAGELELVGEDGSPNGTVLRAGEFLFPNEVLGAAPAPATVRASTGGALILLAERKLAQELLVTCPPLLEIFAGV